MGDFVQQIAVTGIRDAEFEGFVASALYEQGWNVLFRALDFQSLCTYLETGSAGKPLLLLSTDCEGLSPAGLELLREQGAKYILFNSQNYLHDEYPEAVNRPTTTLELVALLRGSLRNPLIRSSHSSQVRARTIILGATSGALGTSTLTINLGAELGELGKKVLIVDAHAESASFASLLGERGLNTSGEIRAISQGLHILEITQESITQGLLHLDRGLSEFDYILIDCGVLRNFGETLTGRRWGSEALIWSTTHADEIWILSRVNHLGLERLRTLINEFSRYPIKPTPSFINAQGAHVKRGSSREDQFLQLTSPLRPTRLLRLPWDPRSVYAAEENLSPLIESNERGLLRKVIANIAGELIS
jgi:hypothetical protein